MKQLAKNGLSMTDAQSISNAVNQACVEIENTINNFNVVSKTIKIEGESFDIQEANPIVDIFDLLKTKSQLHGVQAWLMEALTAKTELMETIREEKFNRDSFTMPTREVIEEPNCLPFVDEEFGRLQLSSAELAEFLEQEAIASHYGKVIHKRGKLTSLRSQLAKHNALEWEVIEDGKRTPVRCKPHHNSNELLDIHNSLSDIWTRANKRVNYFNSKIKSLTNDENVRITNLNAKLKNDYASLLNTVNANYQIEVSNYNAKVDTAQSKFQSQQLVRLKEAAALKIVVDPRFKDIIDEYQVSNN